jgi:hypothetical protein
MRDREVWAFVVGVGLSVVAVIGLVLARARNLIPGP